VYRPQTQEYSPTKRGNGDTNGYLNSIRKQSYIIPPRKERVHKMDSGLIIPAINQSG
jgi:hypothetical protein